MPQAGSAAIGQEDDLVLRAVARGDRHALARLLDAHLDGIYGLLRMALPKATDVEAALHDTFLAAAKQADSAPSQTDTAGWLRDLALQQIAARAVPPPPVPLRGRDREPSGDAPAHEEETTSEVLAGLTDKALAVLIRTLEPRSRQALVLTVHCRLDEATSARIIGCAPSEVTGLRNVAMTGLRKHLAEHEERELALKRSLAPRTAHHLRPLPTMPGGMAVIKGDSVYVESAPSNLLTAIVRVLRRFLEHITKAEHSMEDDDVGGGAKPGRTIDPTPTLKPFEKPELTPSLEAYKNPKLSSGIGRYRAPKFTPSTQRLSNPRRAIPMPAAAWSSARLWRR